MTTDPKWMARFPETPNLEPDDREERDHDADEMAQQERDDADRKGE